MGGEGVQVSDAGKSFQSSSSDSIHYQQQMRDERANSSNSNNSMAANNNPAAVSSSSSVPNAGVMSSSSAGMAYSSGMHYSSAASTSSVGSSDDHQQRMNPSARNSMDMQQQQQHQQQHAHYTQSQMMNAASVMNSGAMNQVTCLVCYNGQVDVMLEPCQHQFHAQCIDRWLNKDKVCPICWIPIQNQRRIMPPAQYAHHPQAAAVPPGGLAPNVPRGNYGANVNKGMSDNGVPGGPVNMSMTPTNGAPLGNDGSGGLAGVATMNANELPNPATMRKGKWTAEESSYCDRLIEEFKKGNLPLAEGTTLRTFLSKLLNCDPMRISKKYTGDQCIGKIIFRRREDEVSKEDMELIRRDLAELEKTYLEREQYNQRRREKRLESELSRDKSRYIAARTLGYNNTPTGANAVGGPAGAGGLPQMAVPVAPVSHYPQQPQGSKDVNIAQAPGHHHPQFPPTRGPMPVQHQAAANVHPPRYPVHSQHPHPQQQPMQSSASHLFNSSMQAGLSSSGGSHTTDSTTSIMSMSNAGSSSSGNNDSVRQSQEHSFLGASNHGVGHNNSSGSSQQGSQQQQQQSQEQNNGESFPRVSSIDSFSCLFPRVASIDNFQLPHQGGSQQQQQQQSNYGGPVTFGESMHSSYDHSNSGGMVKSMSIGDGLNAYFPRIQSLEHLSSLLQEHAPPSPRSATTKDENEHGNKQQTRSEKEDPSSSSSSGLDRKRRGGADSSQSNNSSNQQVKEEQQRDADADLHRRLSPNSTNKPSEHASNQIQIPKPLSKMPRSSSGIFPRIPSMDKLPRIPSMDKHLSSMDKHLSSTDKLPRVPSIDKLSHMSRINSSSDMLSRFGSSDHLSSFPSFSNLSSLSASASFSNLNGLNGGSSSSNLNSGGGGFKSGFPRNSSIEDILSLVASSENGSGLSSAGSHLQLSALAAVAGEESSQLAAADRKRRLEHAQEMESKKNKLSA